MRSTSPPWPPAPAGPSPGPRRAGGAAPPRSCAAATSVRPARGRLPPSPRPSSVPSSSTLPADLIRLQGVPFIRRAGEMRVVPVVGEAVVLLLRVVQEQPQLHPLAGELAGR